MWVLSFLYIFLPATIAAKSPMELADLSTNPYVKKERVVYYGEGTTFWEPEPSKPDWRIVIAHTYSLPIQILRDGRPVTNDRIELTCDSGFMSGLKRLATISASVGLYALTNSVASMGLYLVGRTAQTFTAIYNDRVVLESSPNAPLDKETVALLRDALKGYPQIMPGGYLAFAREFQLEIASTHAWSRHTLSQMNGKYVVFDPGGFQSPYEITVPLMNVQVRDTCAKELYSWATKIL